MPHTPPTHSADRSPPSGAHRSWNHQPGRQAALSPDETPAHPVSARRCPRGCFPAVVTPFRDDDTIDLEGVDHLIDFYMRSGAAGIFACGLSAEITYMADEERLTLAERIVRRVAGRLPVVATAIRSGPIGKQARFVEQMYDTGAELVAIAVCQLAEENEDDAVWIKRFNTFIQQVPASIPLAFYECPLPYWRRLSDQTIEHVAQSGRFVFLKDTCCDIATIGRRLDILRDTPLQLYNAHTPTLLASLDAGADGFCGIGANYFPRLYAWLCRHHRDQPERAGRLQTFLDTTFRPTEGEFYPLSAKWYVRQQGISIGLACRKPLPAATLPAELVEQLEAIRDEEQKWIERLAE